MPTTTGRTPALAYLAALLAILVIWAAYRPLMLAWHAFQNQAPSAAEAMQLLRSENAEQQRQGLLSVTRMRPVADEILIAIADLAFGSADRSLRQQAASRLGSMAQQQDIPAAVLRELPALTPDLDPGLTTSYAILINHTASRQPPPANAVAFLDTLMERGDWTAKNTAIRAFGQIGFYHGMDDRRVAQLTTMVTRKNALGRQIHAADAAWALKLVGQKQALPPESLEVLVALVHDGRDANIRRIAVSAVSTQLPSKPALADVIEVALDDPDSQVRGAARNAINKLETTRPADHARDLQLARDEKEAGTRRLRALQRLLRHDPDDAGLQDVAQLMARHEDPVLRSGMVSIAGMLPDRKAEALLKDALKDPDPQVRAAAVSPLIARRALDGATAQISIIQDLLGDPAPEVRRRVLRMIRSGKLNTDDIRVALRDMQITDPRLDRERSALLASLEEASRTPLQRFSKAVLEPDNYGFFAFVAVAGLAVVICVPSLLYFAARCYVYAAARKWRALAALAVVAVWLGASAALGWAFFIGAFVAGGHNSSPPLGDQLSVAGVLLILVVVYALLGYGLRRLVRH